MFKQVIVFFISLLSLSLLASSGGSVVGNGSGYAELQFNYLYSSLKKCLQSSYIKKRNFNLQEKEVLAFLTSYSPNKQPLFVFKDNKDHFFNINNEEKLALTSLVKDSEIFINKELILNKGRLILSDAEIITLISHELGHHSGEQNHSFLTQLGRKISSSCNNLFFEEESLYYSFITNQSINLLKTRSSTNPNQIESLELAIEGTEIKKEISQKVLSKLKSCKENEVLSFDLTIQPQFHEQQKRRKLHITKNLATVTRTCSSISHRGNSLPRRSNFVFLSLVLETQVINQSLLVKDISFEPFSSFDDTFDPIYNYE